MGSKPQLSEPTETLLELVQLPDGAVVLRPADSEEEPLVSIRFGDQVHKMFGEQLPAIAQVMVQAAVAQIAEQQMARWHAQVMDERPAHLS